MVTMDQLSLFDWVRWVEAPVLLGLLGILIKHVMNDHVVEIAIRTGQARQEGRLEGLHDRVNRLEEISDDRYASADRPRRERANSRIAARSRDPSSDDDESGRRDGC